ncbi:MAG: hypothetical protein C0475_08260 [Planctomyces sp.]|nr:hypothetical protein [Planctomyces sp.]
MGPGDGRPAGARVSAEGAHGAHSAQVAQGAHGTGGLGARARSGFVWTALAALGGKAIGAGQFVVLGWLLSREDLGLVSMAISSALMLSVIQYAGVTDILVSRHRRMHLWANAGFWFALLLGTFSMALVAWAAPVVAWWQGEPWLGPMLLVMSCVVVLNSLNSVPTAVLTGELRLRELALWQLAIQATQTVLTVGMAWWGLGAMSVVLSAAAVAPAMFVLRYRVSGLRLRADPQWRRWRYIVSDSLVLAVVGVMNAAGDRLSPLIIGAVLGPGAVGLYFLAAQFSVQGVGLLTSNLTAVLFPTLNKMLDQPARMLAAFDRAARLMAAVGVMVSAGQAASAGALVRLLLPQDKHAAAAACGLMSLGLCFGVLGSVSTALVKATGRFGRLLWLTAGYASTGVVCIAVGGWLGDVTGAAAGYLAYSCVWGPLGAAIVSRPVGGSWRMVGGIYAPPIASAALGFGPLWLASLWLPVGVWWDILRILTFASVGVVAYLAALARLHSGTYRDLITQAAGPLRRLGPLGRSAGAALGRLGP